ncbi:hypothetical protein FE772_24525 [Lysobacter enzymogenes]|nr:hypothetical protein [Lysobacter enzymogenes]QCW28342.1 hypothetical protein FE772_24525 [Lysobacter enzymogenes]
MRSSSMWSLSALRRKTLAGLWLAAGLACATLGAYAQAPAGGADPRNATVIAITKSAASTRRARSRPAPG